jgi:RHS repeat-associated protein
MAIPSHSPMTQAQIRPETVLRSMPGPNRTGSGRCATMIVVLATAGIAGCQSSDTTTDSKTTTQRVRVADTIVAGGDGTGTAQNATWQFNGSATATATGFLLTDAVFQAVGSVFGNTPYASSSLRIEFDATIGGGTGADGLTLTLLDPSAGPTALGGPGVGLGFGGLAGIAVSLNTYLHYGDPSDNFVGITDGALGPWASTQQLHYLATSTSAPPLRGAPHHAQVTVDAGLLSVNIDGVAMASAQVALPPQVLVGFTGSTGGATDRHAVDNVSIVTAWSALPDGGPPPVAAAGADQSATSATLVTLDGSGSNDSSGGAFTYAWGQTSGPLVLLSDPSAVKPTFITPQVTAATPLVFSLFVSDANGSSSPSTVTVTVSPPASRGPDLTASGTIVALVTAPQGQGSRNLEVIRDGVYPPLGSKDKSTQYDTWTGGSRSEDWIGYTFASPQGFQEVVYQGGIQESGGGWFATLNVQVRQNGTWLNVPGVSAMPAYAGNDWNNFEMYTFDFPVATGDGIRLDGVPGGSDTFVSVGELRVFGASAAGVAVPTAVAGADQNALSLTLAQLDGSQSSDPAASALRYAWTQVSGPAVVISDVTAVNPTFTVPQVDAPTPMVFSLSVANGAVVSPPSTVTVTAMPRPHPGPDLTAGATIIALVTAPAGGGSTNLEVIRDGVYPPIRSWDPQQQYDTFTGQARTEDWIGYEFASPQTFAQLVFQDGIQFGDGGWFTSIQVQVRQGGAWVNVPGVTVTPAYAGNDNLNFETYTFDFPPIAADAIRIDGTPGGNNTFISVGELRVYAASAGAQDGGSQPDVQSGTDSGVCTGACAAQDQCHVAGTCDPTTGACSNPAAANGTTCDDGNPCTLSDSCQSGTCVGTSQVVCVAIDQCHIAGACDPTNGTCSNPPVANGTSCNDGNACTQVDTCQSGSCMGSKPVTCTATDQCHFAGTCDPTSGTCSNPAAADGTTCDDNDACTQVDACSSGVCSGSNPVICTASDQCHGPGVCSPATGRCSNPAQADGTTCDDANACTQNDACAAGICTGSNPVVCTASDACHAPGRCDPNNGTCSNPTAPDGTACPPGADKCQQSYACVGGTCAGSNPVVCTASDECHLGSCDPASGVCSNSNAPDGTACSAHNACTTGDTCASGVCQPGTPVVLNSSDPCSLDTCDPVNGIVHHRCSPVDPSHATVLSDATSFLYAGANPIQTGVAPNTIVPAYAAVLTGHVYAAGGSPLPGVTVRVLNHPEFGTTVSQLNGVFDMAVNGGLRLTLDYSLGGYLPAQRFVQTTWQDYSVVPDVVLVKPAPYAPPVALNSSALVAVQGPITPADGNPSRRGTLLILPSTTATMMVNGSRQALSNISVGITEYTNKANASPSGDPISTMPADLPATSAFTYAFEINAQEAVNAGATETTFNQPLPYYVDDFLNVRQNAAVGTIVRLPLGFYDRTRSTWIPCDGTALAGCDNGVAVTLLACGLDVDGDGTCDSNDSANIPNYSSAEVQALAAVGYTTGQTLWRVLLPHFSEPDINFGFAVDSTATPPNPQGDPVSSTVEGPGPACASGSIIGCQNQTLGERVPLAGTPFSLRYQSDRQRGRLAQLVIPLPPSKPATDTILGFTLTIDIAGRPSTKVSFDPKNMPPSYTFTWDGTDQVGNFLQGQQPVTVLMQNSYPQVHVTVPGFARAAGGGRGGGGGAPTIVTNVGPRPYALQPKVWRGTMGIWDSKPEGLGGWTLNAHHAYDVLGHVIHFGDGTDETPASLPGVIQTVAGNGGNDQDVRDNNVNQLKAKTAYITPTGMRIWPGRTDAGTTDPTQVAPSIYVGSGWGGCIRRIGSDGNVHTVAGFCGLVCNTPPQDGQSAVSQCVGNVADIALGPDGTIYYTDHGGSLWPDAVRRIDPSGKLWTVAGAGTRNTDGAPALQAHFASAASVDLAPDGSLYIADGFPHCAIRRIMPAADGNLANGTITTVAGSLGHCFATTLDPSTWPPNTFAASSSFTSSSFILGDPNFVRVAPDGSFYFSDGGNRVYWRVTPDGIVHWFASKGRGTSSLGEGVLAASSATFFLGTGAIGLAKDGSVYLGDSGAVRLVTPDGHIRTFAGQLNTSDCRGDEGPATSAFTFGGGGGHAIEVAPDGTVYLADTSCNRIRTVGPSLKGFVAPSGSYQFASKDGTQIFNFDGYGRHLTTLDAFTGATLFDFTQPVPQPPWDAQGRFVRVTDVNGDVTAINRDSNDNLVSIQAPANFHKTTTFTPDAHHYLKSVTDAANETTSFTYDANGLMQTMTDANGKQYKFFFDPNGRLTQDQDPAGGSKTLALVTNTLNTQIVTLTTGLNHQTTYQTQTSPANGTFSRLNTLPSGLTSSLQFGPNVYTNASGGLQAGTLTKMFDGTTTAETDAPDPRFGMLAPVAAGFSMKTPSTTAPVTLTSSVSRSATTTSGGALATFSETTTINGHGWQRAFNATTMTWTMTSPANRTTTMVVDNAGRPVQLAYNVTAPNPSVAPISFSYDHGRLHTITQGAHTWTTVYDDANNKITVIDAANTQVVYQTDAMGRPLTTTLQDGTVITTGYDPVGNLTSVVLPGTQPSQTNAHVFKPTAVNLLDTYTPPMVDTNPPQTKYVYDIDRFLTTVTRPGPDPALGTNITLKPDLFGRLGQIVFGPPSSSNISFNYDSQGHISDLPTAASLPIDAKLGYDGPLATSLSWNGSGIVGAVSMAYNSDFRVSQQSVNGVNPLSFNYDNDGLLTQAGALAITPEPANGRLSATSLGSVTDSYLYDGFGLLDTYAASTGSTVLYQEKVQTRDALGRITAKTDTTAAGTDTWAYTYYPAGQLKDATKNGTLTHYGYDGDGNRTQFTFPGSSTNPTYDVQDRLTNYPVLGPSTGFGSQGATYSYTENGELLTRTLTDGSVYSYTYDALGNLLHVGLPPSAGGQSIDYVVDAQGRRVGKKVNGTLTQGFLYQDGLRIVALLDGQSNVAESFVYGSKRNVPDYLVTYNGSGTALATYRILSDHLGSPRVVVDASNPSNVVETMSYDEFGNESETLNAPAGYLRLPFGFAGGLYDLDTKLDRFGARDFDSSVGRWTAKDPTRFRGGINLYGYCSLDPVNCIDRTGRNPAAAVLVLGGGEVIGAGLIAAPFVAIGAAGLAGIAAIDALFANAQASQDVQFAADINAFNASLAVPNTPDQDAVIQIGKEAKQLGGVTPDEAETIGEWAKEYGVPFHGPEEHPDRPFNIPHIHVGPVDHIPVKCQ